MARARRRTTRRRRSNHGAPPWLWALVGLLGGLLIAVVVYLLTRPAAVVAPQEISVPLEKPAQQDKQHLRRKTRKAIPPPPKPRFDFYNLLPEMEVIVPEQEIRGTPTHAGVKRVEKPGTYLLQAGSFPSHQRADRLRAKLALLGWKHAYRLSVSMATGHGTACASGRIRIWRN